MEKKKYDVIFIDSGFTGDVENCQIDGINLINNGMGDFSDSVGHGTQMVNIFLKSCAPESVFIIKIFDSIEAIDVRRLIAALEYVDNNLSCRIINLSLGVSFLESHYELREIVSRLSKRNIIIVSGFSNTGEISFPAAYSNVIGVDVSSNSLLYGEYEYVDNDIINVKASSSFFKVMDHRKEISIINGASAATAYISSVVFKFISTNDNYCLKDVKAYLASHASKMRKGNTLMNNDYRMTIKKAIAFPFNKEMHAIAANEDLLSFQIVQYYDFDLSLNNGRPISDIIKTNINEKEINNYSSIDWEADFDTVILGHCNQIAHLSHFDYLSDVLNKAQEYHKKVYSFERPFLTGLINNEKESVFYPRVEIGSAILNRCGKMYNIGKPVLGIFGTSSQQGKYNLQLNLRRFFISNGYHVGQISSEPSGYLFGMDFVFPFGYRGEIPVDWRTSVLVLNDVIEKLCENNCDIIIAGSQSGTIPYSFNNIDDFHINQFIFLNGCLPDSIILCVNYFDPIEYIKQTISFLENAISTHILSIVLFPLSEPRSGSFSGSRFFIDDSLLLEKKIQIENSFNIPTFINSIIHNDINALGSVIVQYYSSNKE